MSNLVRFLVSLGMHAIAYLAIANLMAVSGSADAAEVPAIAYHYDRAGRLVGVADDAGNGASYEYDSVGNILSVSSFRADQVALVHFEPVAGIAGTEVVILGSGFDRNATANKVTFGSAEGVVVNASPTRIVVKVPENASSGVIRISTPKGMASSRSQFTVSASRSPAIMSFSPAVGADGTAIVVGGQNLAGPFHTGATLAGAVAGITALSPSSLTVLVPANARSGKIAVETPHGVASSATDFFIAPGTIAPAHIELTGRIAKGDRQEVAIAGKGKKGMLLFEGTAGERISILLESAFLGSGHMALLPPSGMESGRAYQHGALSFMEPLPLRETGTYTIFLVPDGASAGRGMITLSAVQDVAATLGVGGPAQELASTVPGQNFRLHFSGTAGQRILVTASSAQPGMQCPAVLRAGAPGSGTPMPASCNGVLNAVTVLPSTGAHAIELNPAGPGVGKILVALSEPPPDTVMDGAIDGAISELEVPGAGQSAVLRFSGMVGEYFSVGVTGISSSLGCVSFVVKAPDSAAIAAGDSCGTDAFIDTARLPATGTYVLQMKPWAAGVGRAAVRLYRVPVNEIVPLAIDGPPVRIHARVPGHNPALLFAGAAGQVVSLSVSDHDHSLQCVGMLSSGPKGESLFAVQDACPASAHIGTALLGSSGSFRIDVNPYGAETGGMTVSLKSNAPVAMEPDGNGATAVISKTAPVAYLSFNGISGQHVGLQVTELSSTLSCVSISVMAPGGAVMLDAEIVCGTDYLFAPVLPATGNYIVKLEPLNSGSSGSVSFALHSITDVFHPISGDGVPVKVDLARPGQQAILGFSGTAGQAITLSVTEIFFRCIPISIRKPDGTVLVRRQDECSSGFLLDQTVLPDTGTYTILMDPAGRETGSATFRLFNVPVQIPSAVIDGAPVPIVASVPGQKASVSFSGLAGQRISITISGISKTLSCPVFSIMNPDISYLTEPVRTCGTSLFLEPAVLPVAGTYTLLMDPSGLSVGSATITITAVPEDTRTQISIGGPAVRAGTTVAGQNASLFFNAAAGQQVSLKMTSITGDCMDVSIRRPDGIDLIGPDLTCGSAYFIEPFSMPVAGEYVILLNPRQASLADAVFALAEVPDDASGMIEIGGVPARLATTVSGQNAKLTFEGRAGQRISLDVTAIASSLGCPVFSIVKPDGTDLVAPGYTCSSTYFIDSRVLPLSGIYTIVMNPKQAYVGGAVFTLFEVPADASGTAEIGGTPFVAAITVPGQNASFGFSAIAGQIVTLHLSENKLGCPTITLHTAAGAALGSMYTCSSSKNLTSPILPVDGSYAVSIDPRGSSLGTAKISVTSP